MNARLFSPALALWFCGAVQSFAAELGSLAPRSAAVMAFELINEMRDYETDDSRAGQH